MLNPLRSNNAVQSTQDAAAAAPAEASAQDTAASWEGVANQKEAVEVAQLLALRSPATAKPKAKKAPQRSLVERAGHLVEDKNSLRLPDLVGGLGLELVALAAKQQGLRWFRESDVDALLPELEQLRKRVHQDLELPKPYLRGFHGFSENANLQYLHALNMEPAIAQFAGVSMPEVGGANKARRHMLDLTANQIKDYLGKRQTKVHTLVDVGCGSGVTTNAFGENFPSARVVGLDASEYMLAEAQRLTKPTAKNVRWSNQLAQDTKLGDGSVDVYATVFMAHEQKKEIMEEVLKEAYRVLKPGGVLAISDYDTQRPLVQLIAHAPGPVVSLASNIIFEPHLGDYLGRDFAATGAQIGFVDYKREKTCPNVQLLLLRKPSK